MGFRVKKCDVTNNRICEIIAFAEIDKENKTENTSFLKISIIVQIYSELNDPAQVWAVHIRA